MSASDYADLLLGRRLNDADFNQRYGSGWRPIEEAYAIFCAEMRAAFSAYGYDVGNKFDKNAIEYVSWLLEQRGFSGEGDEYTGYYVLLHEVRKNQLVDEFLRNQEQSKRVIRLGDDALRKALKSLSLEGGWGELKEASENGSHLEDMAPASDRIVTFSDNQISELDSKVTEVIEVVSLQNQIAAAPGLREIVLGQLKAGRELIRAGSFRLHLLEIALVEALKMLIIRYEKEAIGALASTLLAALANHIGTGS